MSSKDRSTVQIDVLGALCVTENGNQHRIQASKVRTMVAVLALEAGRAISYSELVDELWPGQSLGNVQNALQGQASRLRKVVDGPVKPRTATVLRAVHNGYVLDVPRECVDGHRFLDLAAASAAALPDHPGIVLTLAQDALRLWRGPALLDAGDGLRCQAAAALLEERRLAVWEDLVNARLATGGEAQAVAELRQLVTQHPLRERFCEQLMLGLYRCGQQSEALSLFHRTRHLLDKELGLRPGVGMQRLYAAILAQDMALLEPAAGRGAYCGVR
jgi:SARP family transcriptional regulator, regulator of embCAB operon